MRAVISEPPSLPLNNISLSETADLITKSVEEFNNLPNSVPPSLNWNPPLSESNIMSDATSKVKVPELTSISLPSIVMLSTTTPAFAVIAPDGTRVPVTANPELVNLPRSVPAVLNAKIPKS